MPLRIWGNGRSAPSAAVPLSSWARCACALLSPGPPALLALRTKIMFLLLFAVVTLRKKKRHKNFCGLKGTKQEARACCAACSPSLGFPYIDAVAAYPTVARRLRPRPVCSLPAGGDVRAALGGAAARWPRACGPVRPPAAWGTHLGALRASVLSRLSLPPEPCTACRLVRPDAGW